MKKNHDIDPLSKEILNNLKNKEKEKGTNKKNNTINIILHEKNIEIIDLLSKKFETSRSYIINYILKKEIESMFYALPDKEKVIFALEADRRITQNTETKHIYNNETWLLKAKRLPDDHQNPSILSVVFGKSEIKDITNE
jgi:predicted DNA-binding protein